jgi:hypothetical protein
MGLWFVEPQLTLNVFPLRYRERVDTHFLISLFLLSYPSLGAAGIFIWCVLSSYLGEGRGGWWRTNQRVCMYVGYKSFERRFDERCVRTLPSRQVRSGQDEDVYSA